MIYRAYRYPYDYVPQMPKPEEVAIAPIDNNDFRMPGAKGKEFTRVTKVEGTKGYSSKAVGFCVAIEEDEGPAEEE